MYLALFSFVIKICLCDGLNIAGIWLFVKTTLTYLEIQHGIWEKNNIFGEEVEIQNIYLLHNLHC